ncbi:MAG: alpha/beta hydrolase [Pyrinomonadaceae bacterium]|nr:alpha/beta hydrolase [Pyrinomonadaceae bacterium]
MTTVRTADGISISYKTLGDGPRNLLFMHGWAGSSSYWDELLKHLNLAGLRAITYDMRGHGESDRAETGFTLDHIAQDALAVADYAGADKFVLIGFSMSGKFAQYVSCICPDRVEGQILIAGSPAGVIPFPQETYAFFLSCAENREMMRVMISQFIKERVQAEVMDRFLDWAIKVPLVALEGTLNTCINESFAEKLAEVRTRTIVIAGSHDPIFSPEALGQGVVAPLSRARLALVDCSHEIPIEKPRELAALIEAFLAGLGNND